MNGDRMTDDEDALSRRLLFQRSTLGAGSWALASLLGSPAAAGPAIPTAAKRAGALTALDFAPRAKRVIMLFMSGAPSQIELFDPKPVLSARAGEELPESVRGGTTPTAMGAPGLPLLLVGSAHGTIRDPKTGLEFSEHLPHLNAAAHKMAVVRSVSTDPINHDPAVTFFNSGRPQPGRPSLGSWAAYGLGSDNENLPTFVVLLSGAGGQPLLSRYWHQGFLPGGCQGAPFQSTNEPVLFTSDPPGVDRAGRRSM
ncbi:MAG: DUF1501 domain-containing protein, partial [Planctomycetia bacterium]